MKNNSIYHNDAVPNTTKARVKEFLESKYSWWSRNKFIIMLTLVMSVMDGLVLYSVFDKAMMQSWYMGIVMAFGISVVLNLIPIFVSKFVHRAIYKTHKHAKLLAGTAIAAFLILYGATVYLRFAYQDMYGDVEETSITNTLTSDDTQDVEEDNGKEARSRAIVVLLAIEPLATSICGFVLSFLSDDELEREIEILEVQIADLEYEIAWKKAGIASMKDKDTRLNLELALDEEILAGEKNTVIAKGEALKARAREILAMALRDPESISKLSFQLSFEEPQGKSNLYEYPAGTESIHAVTG
ncbi:MAG: hypothetical protein J6M44_14175 [Butyrivibrio sp.]|uniref:hypothetical protein n=1 Tax=Butyrivibrio sp. TaxID=28121 RepID=UPI001B25D892|nr:hypothetical protein [Butyrivibrio sp.]MBO6240301.1 hypothetical protein [Butyrivibrio sp.]MBP3280093.1 hypothetical protein [Butyrivibrio sp.]